MKVSSSNGTSKISILHTDIVPDIIKFEIESKIFFCLRYAFFMQNTRTYDVFATKLIFSGRKNVINFIIPVINIHLKMSRGISIFSRRQELLRVPP